MEKKIITMYIWIIGMCTASFINVVIDRIPKKKSVIKGRSSCPTCSHVLGVMDMIPVISYLMLKGKCRYCKTKLSVREPWIELLGGFLAILCFYVYGNHWMSMVSFLFSMILLAISCIDFDTMIIPDRLNLCVLLIGLISTLVSDISLKERLIGMWIVSLPLFLMNLLIPDSFGGGDIKLLICCGFMLGWKNTLVGMIFAVLSAGSYATYLLFTKKRNRKEHIAFGPYICMGMFTALLAGNQIINAYVSWIK